LFGGKGEIENVEKEFRGEAEKGRKSC